KPRLPSTAGENVPCARRFRAGRIVPGDSLLRPFSSLIKVVGKRCVTWHNWPVENAGVGARDIDTARGRDVIRQEAREAPLAAGVILPPPAPKPKRRGPLLRLIEK